MNSFKSSIKRSISRVSNLKPRQIKSLMSVLMVTSGLVFAVVLVKQNQDNRGRAQVLDGVAKWHTLTIDFTHTSSLSESQNSPNPFLDFRLNVTFTSPTGRSFVVPGFFDGNGTGGGSGNVWRVRFVPDEVGPWTYATSFKSGANIAVDLNPASGTSASFDGETGTFDVTSLDQSAPGFLKYGMLKYTGGHYLKFVDGGYFIKGGVDNPENFLGYRGFDNTVKQAGGSGLIHQYPNHVANWQTGDPNFVSADTGYDAKGIIGSLNYLASQNVNSIYFLPMNLGGDARDTYPFINPANTADAKRHYDISKLNQWNTVFNHATNKGILMQFVLAETELDNRLWLDNGTLDIERKLYFRELVSRFGHNLAVKWNISEENVWSFPEVNGMAQYLKDLDPYDHPIAVHTPIDQDEMYAPYYGNINFSASSVQYTPDSAAGYVESIRTLSANAARAWVVDMDENTQQFTDGYIRKKAMYDILFSGGNVEWYLGHGTPPLDHSLEDFASREALWQQTWYARKFMLDNLPFWRMSPNDGLVTGGSTAGSPQVLAKTGEVYAIYLVSANPSGNLNLTGAPGTYHKKWYNPRTGNFEGTTQTITGGGVVPLGSPPSSPDEDWVVFVAPPNYTPPVDSAYIEQNGLVVFQAESQPLGTGWSLETSIPGFTGTGYMNWTAPDNYPTPGPGLTKYPIWITNPGIYNLRMYNYRNNPIVHESNDLWSRIDGEIWYKTYSWHTPVAQWNWITNYAIEEPDNMPPATVNLSAGLHTLYLSGRSSGFRIDRIHLYKSTATNPLDLGNPQSPFTPPDSAPPPPSLTPTPAVPTQPEYFQVVKNGNQVTLSWYPVSSATNYRVERCSATNCSDQFDFNQIASVTTTSYVDTMPDPNRVYHYKVRAYNGQFGPYTTTIPSHVTWTIQATPFCANGKIPTQPVRVSHRLFPSGTEFIDDVSAPGVHTVTVTSNHSSNNGYFRMYATSGGATLPPTGEPPHPGINYGTYFGSSLAQLHRNINGSPYPPVPSGTYVVNYLAPDAWCERQVIFNTGNAGLSGNLGGLSGADAICQERAGVAGLPGTFRAWLSTGSIHARTRFVDMNLGGFVLPNNVKVADNMADLLDGSILASIDRNEFGNQTTAHKYTGTNPDGTKAPNRCQDWTTSNSANQGVFGMNAVDGLWTWAGVTECSNLRNIICIQTDPNVTPTITPIPTATSTSTPTITPRPTTTISPAITGASTATPTITSRRIPGDTNDDNKVDGVDYVTWARNYGQLVEQGDYTVGNFNMDTIVDGLDYVILQTNYTG